MNNNENENAGKGGLSTKTVEIIVAAIFIFVGILVIYDSLRVGIGWASDGPRAGYFPFYIGLMICVASAWILLQALLAKNPDTKPFIGVGKLRPVLYVLIPSVIYVAVIYLVGIYVASALFIALFMRYGEFSWAKCVSIGLGVPVSMFLMFEKWFLVPLPKGPLEALLGF